MVGAGYPAATASAPHNIAWHWPGPSLIIITDLSKQLEDWYGRAIVSIAN